MTGSRTHFAKSSQEGYALCGLPIHTGLLWTDESAQADCSRCRKHIDAGNLESPHWSGIQSRRRRTMRTIPIKDKTTAVITAISLAMGAWVLIATVTDTSASGPPAALVGVLLGLFWGLPVLVYAIGVKRGHLPGFLTLIYTLLCAQFTVLFVVSAISGHLPSHLPATGGMVR